GAPDVLGDRSCLRITDRRPRQRRRPIPARPCPAGGRAGTDLLEDGRGGLRHQAPPLSERAFDPIAERGPVAPGGGAPDAPGGETQRAADTPLNGGRGPPQGASAFSTSSRVRSSPSSPAHRRTACTISCRVIPRLEGISWAHISTTYSRRPLQPASCAPAITETTIPAAGQNGSRRKHENLFAQPSSGSRLRTPAGLYCCGTNVAVHVV